MNFGAFSPMPEDPLMIGMLESKIFENLFGRSHTSDSVSTSDDIERAVSVLLGFPTDSAVAAIAATIFAVPTVAFRFAVFLVVIAVIAVEVDRTVSAAYLMPAASASSRVG